VLQPLNLPVSPVVAAPVGEPEPESLGLQLFKLGAFSCRWISEGTGLDARFCGHRTLAPFGTGTRGSYCEHHFERLTRKAA